MDQQIEAAAEAICAVTGAGRMFPWDTLNEGERDAWREMARAAIQALGLTTHWGVGTLDESDNLIDVNANLFHSPEDARKGMQELRLMYGKRRCLVSRFGQSPWVVVEHPQDRSET